MLKKACDCCNKDANSDIKFKLPTYFEIGAFNRGVKLATFRELKDVEMDLCDSCIVKIANFIQSIKNIKEI